MSDPSEPSPCGDPTEYGPCGSYLTVAEADAFGCCHGLELLVPPEEEGGEPTEGGDYQRYELALWWATRRVFLATGQRFFGCCESKIRPCRSACSGLAGVMLPTDFPWATWPLRGSGWDGGYLPLFSCSCAPGDPCSCSSWDQVPLPLLPVRNVVEVKIDGEVLDASAYTVIDQAWLARTDGGQWPSCQSREPDTEPGTWSVTYRHGLDLPPEALPLVAAYACQLAKRCAGSECDLPEGVTIVERDGVQFGVAEPAEYRALGLTGYGPIDDWVALLNQGHVQEPPRIYRPGRERPLGWLEPVT